MFFENPDVLWLRSILLTSSGKTGIKIDGTESF